MTSVTPTTGQGTPENSNLPLLTSFILIGGFILVLAILLGGMNPAADTTTEATTVASAETAVEVTPVTLNVTGEGQPTAAPTEVAVAVAAAFPYTDAQIAEGSTVFSGLCSACHGLNARGIVGVGKDLVGGEFPLTTPDDELHAFVIVGRQPWDAGNTTGVAMPARGGNPMLSDEQLYSVIGYLRRLQLDNGFVPVGYESFAAPVDPNAAPTSTPTAAPPTPTPTEAVIERATPEGVGGVIVANSTPVPMEFVVASEFNLSCAGCHGIDGQGDGMLTPALDPTSPNVSDDAAMIEYLSHNDPFSGGYVHPIFPQYTADQLQQVVDYTQSLLTP